MSYLLTALGGQHVPGRKGFHDFCTGEHLIHIKSAVRPMAMFMDTRINQTNAFVQPFVMRSSVMEKLVLLQMAAMMEKVPATLVMGTSVVKFSMGKSQMCLP